MGSAKNACFALSCLAADKDGNQRVIGNNAFNDVLNRLVLLLANDEDVEAAWFAAMYVDELVLFYCFACKIALGLFIWVLVAVGAVMSVGLGFAC